MTPISSVRLVCYLCCRTALYSLALSNRLQRTNGMNHTWNSGSSSDDAPVEYTRPTSSRIAEYGYLLVSILFLFLAVITCCFTPIERMVRYCVHHGPTNQQAVLGEPQSPNQEGITQDVPVDSSNPVATKDDSLIVKVKSFIG
jgi:hypothetical protein